MAQPWSSRPFQADKAMQVPIYNFKAGTFSGEIVELDQSIYNLPLRRDIVKNVFDYF